MAELLSGRDAGDFLGEVRAAFGASFDESRRFFSKRDGEELRVFLYSGDSLPDLKVEWIGLHVATLSPRGLLLTIEGAQLVGPSAERGVVSVSGETAKELMSGREVKMDGYAPRQVLIESEGEFICGGSTADGVITPYVPKSRRLGE